MKKYFALILLTIASLAIPCSGETVQLAWDAPPAGDSAIAYHVYASNAPGVWEAINSVRMPATECVVVLPDDGKTWRVVVRGFNGTVESASSNEIIVTTKYVAPAAVPKNFRKKVP